MKKIECILRAERLREVSAALRLAGIGGMSVTEIKGFGRNTTRPEAYLFLPKSKIEIYVTEDQVEEVVGVLLRYCRDEHLGSGKIAVLPLEECIRVRTGERGPAAIV
ncbi:MAG: P-II family nitrogen regulator [Candidatus Omnitrophica bacterium]|nr:P-II family nitrogen regulator [Candidatus Omnitrophota bacterium]